MLSAGSQCDCENGPENHLKRRSNSAEASYCRASITTGQGLSSPPFKSRLMDALVPLAEICEQDGDEEGTIRGLLRAISLDSYALSRFSSALSRINPDREGCSDLRLCVTCAFRFVGPAVCQVAGWTRTSDQRIMSPPLGVFIGWR
jgi:hypothetical protein